MTELHARRSIQNSSASRPSMQESPRCSCALGNCPHVKKTRSDGDALRFPPFGNDGAVPSGHGEEAVPPEGRARSAGGDKESWRPGRSRHSAQAARRRPYCAMAAGQEDGQHRRPWRRAGPREMRQSTKAQEGSPHRRPWRRAGPREMRQSTKAQEGSPHRRPWRRLRAATAPAAPGCASRRGPPKTPPSRGARQSRRGPSGTTPPPSSRPTRAS